MPLPKKPQPSVNRQPQGVPVGGQFAATTHSEPDVSLSAEKGYFSEENKDPNLAAALADDGDTGDDPTHDFLASGGGNGSLPPLPPRNGGSGNKDDDKEREASVLLMTNAVKKHAAQIVNSGATTINISARDNNGTLRFDDVLRSNGQSIDDEYGSLARSLTGEVNANRVGGGIPAEQILGNAKSAAIDAVALFSGEIKIVGPGKPPRY